MLHKRGTFLAAGTTIPQNTILRSTLIGGTDFTSKQIDVTGAKNITIILEVTGENALINADILVDFVVSIENETPSYSTINTTSQVYETVVCRSTDNSAERVAAIIPVEGISFIGIGRLRNEDLTYDATVQVYYGKYENIV